MPLILLLILLVSLTPVSMANTVVIGVSDSNPGALSYKDSKFVGEAKSYFQCALDNFSMPYEIFLAPNSRLFQLFEHQQIDIFLPLARTQERDEIGTFSESLFEHPFLLFANRHYKDLSNLQGDSIVSVRAAAPNERIKRNNGNLIEVASYRQGVQMIKYGRADGVVFPEAALGPLLDEINALDDIKRHVFFRQDIGMYINTSRADVLKAMNSSIARCKD